MTQAFALRAEYTGTITGPDDDGQEITVDKFRGASLGLPDGSLFDIGEALQAGGGVIVTDDPVLVNLLDFSGFLKHVGVPDEAPRMTSLDSLGVMALRDTPEGKRITGVGGMRKAELIARIERARSGLDPNVPLIEGPDESWIEAPPEGEGTDAKGGQS